MTKPIWDLDENEGMEIWRNPKTDTYVKVRNEGSYRLRKNKASLLFFLDEFTDLLQYRISRDQTNVHHHPKNEQERRNDVFWKTPHFFMEIPRNNMFTGLNKPKDIRLTSAERVGKDENLRASYRIVMLDMSKFDDFYEVKELYTHELAHTMANHVRFRPNDHHDDFKRCQSKLKKYLNENEFDTKVRTYLIKN